LKSRPARHHRRSSWPEAEKKLNADVKLHLTVQNWQFHRLNVVMAKGGNVLSVIALIPVLAFNLNKTENVLTIQNMKIILTIQNTKIIVAFKLKQE
jgi:hypothetical protein